MKRIWFSAARRLILPLAAPVLMAGTCNNSGPAGDDEERCNSGADTEQCRVSVSMRNNSGDPIHIWTPTSNETIGPLNQLSAGTERCRASLVLIGTTHTFSVSAGRNGATLDTESVTFNTIDRDKVILADWNGSSLTVSTRDGSTVCIA